MPALLFPVIILGSIYAGIATPTEAAAISIVYVVFIEVLFYKTTKLNELPRIVGKSVVEAGTMTILLGASGPSPGWSPTCSCLRSWQSFAALTFPISSCSFWC